MIERIAIISLVSLLFYLKTLGYKYASDDIPAYNRPKDPNKWMQWFWVLEGRARHSPQFDHALTMAIHAMVCVGIYLAFGANDVSFLSALLFCVNPATNQASVWISGRSYALPALGLVWSLAIPILAPILIICASYYNAGFTSPLMLVGSPFPWLALLLPLGWNINYSRFKKNVLDKAKAEMFFEDKQLKPEKSVLFIKTFGFYTILALIPFKNTFYHSFLQSAAGSGKHKAYTIKCRFFWIGVVTIASIFTYWLTTPWTMASFGLLWWAFCIAPFCNLFRIHQEIAERYLYLPSIGLMFFLATVIINNPVWAAVFLTMYATKMWFYMDAFQDDYFLIEQACLNSPDSWFAWHVRGMKRWDSKSYQEALILWTMARMLSPKEMKILINLATVLKLSGHHQEADEFIKLAEANVPSGQEDEARKIIDEWRNNKMAILL